MEQQKNPMHELMKLVNILSQAHDVIVDDKHGNFLGSRQEEPLLAKLRKARVASTSGRAGGSLAKDRSPLNVAAVDLYDRIVGEIREWYGHETDYGEERVFQLPEATLRQWFLRYANRWRAKQVSDDYAWDRVKTVNAWAVQVNDLLDPPFRFPLTSPCPACGESWVEAFNTEDADEVERVRVLNAVERERIEDSYVLCKACEKVWKGPMAARQLRIAIDDAEADRQNLAELPESA